MGREMIQEHQTSIHNQILKLRSIERLLQSDKFEDAYGAATGEDFKELDTILKILNIKQLKLWIFKINEGSLETMSSRRLKELCKEQSIPYWSRLDRIEMIEELNAKSFS